MKQLPKDTQDYLAPARKKQPEISKTHTVQFKPITLVGYTYGGHPTEECPTCLPDDSNCLAIKAIGESERGIAEKYYVKGDDNGNLYDPWNLLSEQHTTFDRLKGKNIWTFKEVKNRAFEFYKQFLRTRNQLFKRYAEREVDNA